MGKMFDSHGCDSSFYVSSGAALNLVDVLHVDSDYSGRIYIDEVYPLEPTIDVALRILQFVACSSQAEINELQGNLENLTRLAMEVRKRGNEVIDWA